MDKNETEYLDVEIEYNKDIDIQPDTPEHTQLCERIIRHNVVFIEKNLREEISQKYREFENHVWYIFKALDWDTERLVFFHAEHCIPKNHPRAEEVLKIVRELRRECLKYEYCLQELRYLDHCRKRIGKRNEKNS